MATLREYFSGDFQSYVACEANYDFKSNDNELAGEIIVQRLIDFAQETQFTAFFVSASKALFWAFIHAHLQPLSQATVVSGCHNVRIGRGIAISLGSKISLKNEPNGPTIGYLGRSTETYYISRRVYVYWENELAPNEEIELNEVCSRMGFLVTIRTTKYAEEQDRVSTPIAFISHDSRDKAVVREIARELSSKMLHVWYDEFSLKPGDRLRESIEGGLKKAPVCILFLSKNFIENNRWAQVEFNSVFQLEINDQRDRFLPIWFDVSKDDLANYSPSLLNRVAVNWSGPNAMNELILGIYNLSSRV